VNIDTYSTTVNSHRSAYRRL